MSPLLADTMSAKRVRMSPYWDDHVSKHNRLIAVLSRVRLQRSFEFPIAPQNISSWILLLHVRSHPTGSIGT
jgi:hypothetical protein